MNVSICVMDRAARQGKVNGRLPAEKNDLWQKLWETKAKSLDDCLISNAETGVAAADRFLRSVDLYRVDIFELNTFARKLDGMMEREKLEYCRRLEQEPPNSLKAAIYSAKMEVSAT